MIVNAIFGTILLIPLIVFLIAWIIKGDPYEEHRVMYILKDLTEWEEDDIN